MTGSDSTEFIALVPAGGTGSRVGSDRPKQYLPILGQPMIERTINALLACDWIRHVYVVVSPQDPHQAILQRLSAARCSVLPVGGNSRRDSVLAGLQAIEDKLTGHGQETRQDAAQQPMGGPMPWVMVHDAARPGLSVSLLERLRDCVLAQSGSNAERASGEPSLTGPAFGALLAVPVADTIKREAEREGDALPRVEHTVDRTGLWAAQTPQVFPLDFLRRALTAHDQATDEASAIERLGYSPALVPGHWHNMKVTTAEDLALIRQVLEARQNSSPTTTALIDDNK